MLKPVNTCATTVIILALSLLAGCADEIGKTLGTRIEPLPSPSPYRFTLGSFEDLRDKQDADKWQSPFVFRTSQFMQSWQSVWPTATYGEQPASLSLALRNYASSKSGANDYAVSMVMDMRGTDQYSRPLGTTTGQCSVVMHKGFNLDELAMATQTKGEGCRALAPCAQDARMWRMVFTNCVRQLTGQFSQAIHTTGAIPKEHN
jgi:hypothetical protein